MSKIDEMIGDIWLRGPLETEQLALMEEAMDALYKEGKMVKALDSIGKPKMRGVFRSTNPSTALRPPSGRIGSRKTGPTERTGPYQACHVTTDVNVAMNRLLLD